MKKCIWCLKIESETSFFKLAHTIPQSLGGKNICVNVCDECNHYFGSYNDKLPPIETILKETFNISRARLLASQNEIGKNRVLAKFSSIYFKVDLKNHKLDLKPSYQFIPDFQEKICRQLKKGLYKIFLEERERKYGDGHDVKYNFIRSFARYNKGNIPVFYFERLFGVIAMSVTWIRSPELFFEKEEMFDYLINSDNFYEFELLGHVFGFPITFGWENHYEKYLNDTILSKKKFFRRIRRVENFNDVDLSLSILDDYHRP